MTLTSEEVQRRIDQRLARNKFGIFDADIVRMVREFDRQQSLDRIYERLRGGPNKPSLATEPDA